MDGCGKTTVAKALAERFNYQYLAKPFAYFFEGMGFDSKQIKDIEWKVWETEDEALITLLYGMGLLYGTRCIAEDNIVYDRHYASNYYWHGNVETDSLHKEIMRLGGQPDLTIVLVASVETRMRRIYERDKTDQDLSNSAMYDYGYKKLVHFLNDNNISYVIIDTENKPVEEIIAEAIVCIKKAQPTKLVKERNETNGRN